MFIVEFTIHFFNQKEKEKNPSRGKKKKEKDERPSDLI